MPGRWPAPFIVVAEAGEPDEMFEWLKLGAADFITAPLKAGEVLPRIWQLLEQNPRRPQPVTSLKERLGTRLLVGESPAFLKEVNKIPLIARCNASVLISGETGPGGGLRTRIHYRSPQTNKPLIPVNCGAIPTELVENELFGHERGAYTGAKDSQVGLIQEADGGTIFLDEIEHLPLLSQVKLLRFLQEKEYRPLGSARTVRADVRVIAAMNCDPEEAVKAGKLRRDLYYRLNVIPLVLPPLRERARTSRRWPDTSSPGTPPSSTSASRTSRPMPSACSSPTSGRATSASLSTSSSAPSCSARRGSSARPTSRSRRRRAFARRVFPGREEPHRRRVREEYIERARLMSHGNISRAARSAQKSRRAFWELMRKHRIDVKT